MSLQLNNYRLLGRSGLRISPMCFGTMTFGMDAAWGTPDDEAVKMVHHYMDRGGNFFDTANMYGRGGSEKVLGRALKDRRPRSVIATKYSLSLGQGDPNAGGNHRKNMMQSVEDSLGRLDTDYIDLLYLHMWDRRTPVDEILRGFDDLVRQGKVLYIGLSDTPAWQASRMQAIAELRGWSQFAALQILYNLTDRAVERELMPMALEMGMGVLPWSPLGGGVLAGKYTKKDLVIPEMKQLSDMNTRQRINVATGRLNERTLGIADVVKEIATEMNRTPSQVALAWTMLHSAVAAPILGIRTMPQLEDNFGALEVSFTADQIARLEKVSAIELGFPNEMILGPHADAMLGGCNVALRPGR